MPTAFKQVADNAIGTIVTPLITPGITSVSLATGEGSNFPAPGNGFRLKLWNNALYPNTPYADPDLETVICSARVGDVLTISATANTHASPCTAAIVVDAQETIDLQTAVNNLESGSGSYPYEQTANKGAANGYAPLNASSAVPVANLPAASTSTFGVVELAGDLAGTAASPTVTSTHLASPLPVLQGGTGATTSPLLAVNNLDDVTDVNTARYQLHVGLLTSVQAVAISNITLSGTQTVDGYAAVVGDEILCVGQTTASQNGPWVVASGAWTRPSDFPSGGQIKARYIQVNGGNTYANTSWQTTNTASITIDTTFHQWHPISYNSATLTIAPFGSGFKADRYTFGSNDDAVFTAAYTTLSGSGNGTIFAKRGNYILNNPIVPAPGVALLGEDWGTVFLPTGVDICAFRPIIQSPSNPYPNLRFANFKIDGTNNTLSTFNPSNGKGFFIQYAPNLRIENVYVYNTQTTGIGTDFLPGAIIRGNRVENCGRAWSTGRVGCNGIGIGTGYYASENVLIKDNVIVSSGVGNAGILIEDQFATTRSRGFVISGNYVSGYNVGIQDSGTSGAIIANNYVSSPQTHGVEIFTGDIQIPSQAFNPQDVLVVGNFIENAGTASHNIYVFDAKNDGTLSGIDIRSNTIIGSSIHGISIVNANHFSINGNRCYKNGQSGVNITCTSSSSPVSHGDISNNHCYNNAQSDGAHDGIRLATTAGSISDISIVGNHCYDDQVTPTQRYGISTGTNVTNCFFDANVLGTNKTAPINITATDTHTFGINPGVPSYNTVSSTYTVTAIDKKIFANATSAGFTITLPDATLCGGRDIFVKKVDNSANTVTLSTVSAQTIDGASTDTLSVPNLSVTLSSNGSNWYEV